MSSNYYFDRTSELNILGNWLNGRHKEDAALLDVNIFQLKDLYKAAISGNKTFLQLMAENKADGVTLSELLNAMDPIGTGGILAEAAYQDAKATALFFQRDIFISQLSDPGADIPATTAKLLQLQATIDKRESKPAAANLADTLLKAIDDEAQATKIKYGRGFENLDKYAGSMKRGQLIVLAARPATGKSAAALQIAYNVYDKGSKVLFFPLEMTTTETLERLILQNEIIESQTALKAPREDEKNDIKAFLDAVEANGDFLIYEGVNQLETIEQTIKEQRPDLVVIDQLTQVRTSRRTKDIRERYVEITADLKHIAIEYQTTILLLTQLNREAADKRPTLENLHESDATGQNADVVLLMQKKEADDTKPGTPKLDNIDIYIVKNRGGASDKKIAHKFSGNKYRFYSVGR